MENEPGGWDVKSIIILLLLVLLIFCITALVKTNTQLRHAQETIATWQQSGENWRDYEQAMHPGNPLPASPETATNH